MSNQFNSYHQEIIHSLFVNLFRDLQYYQIETLDDGQKRSKYVDIFILCARIKIEFYYAFYNLNNSDKKWRHGSHVLTLLLGKKVRMNTIHFIKIPVLDFWNESHWNVIVTKIKEHGFLYDYVDVKYHNLIEFKDISKARDDYDLRQRNKFNRNRRYYKSIRHSNKYSHNKSHFNGNYATSFKRHNFKHDFNSIKSNNYNNDTLVNSSVADKENIDYGLSLYSTSMKSVCSINTNSSVAAKSKLKLNITNNNYVNKLPIDNFNLSNNKHIDLVKKIPVLSTQNDGVANSNDDSKSLLDVDHISKLNNSFIDTNDEDLDTKITEITTNLINMSSVNKKINISSHLNNKQGDSNDSNFDKSKAGDYNDTAFNDKLVFKIKGDSKECNDFSSLSSSNVGVSSSNESPQISNIVDDGNITDDINECNSTESEIINNIDCGNISNLSSDGYNRDINDISMSSNESDINVVDKQDKIIVNDNCVMLNQDNGNESKSDDILTGSKKKKDDDLNVTNNHAISHVNNLVQSDVINNTIQKSNDLINNDNMKYVLLKNDNHEQISQLPLNKNVDNGTSSNFTVNIKNNDENGIINDNDDSTKLIKIDDKLLNINKNITLLGNNANNKKIKRNKCPVKGGVRVDSLTRLLLKLPNNNKIKLRNLKQIKKSTVYYGLSCKFKSNIFKSEYILNNQYEIIKCIGKGRDSHVFRAFDLIKHYFIAIKVECIDRGSGLLKEEYKIMNVFKNSPYICDVYAFGELPKDVGIGNYLCMELCKEQNLSDLRKQCAMKCFGIQKGALIGIEMILALQCLHKKGYVHRDIKPSNFLIPQHQSWDNQLYLADFGMAKECRLSNCSIQSYDEFVGTTLYASITAHNQLKLSFIDDLWSIFFIILDISLNSLPWKDYYIKMSSQPKKRRDQIGIFKKNFISFMSTDKYGDDFKYFSCFNINYKDNVSNFRYNFSYNFPKEYKDFVQLLNQTKFNDIPRYSALIEILSSIAFNNKFNDYQNVVDHAPKLLSFFFVEFCI